MLEANKPLLQEAVTEGGKTLQLLDDNRARIGPLVTGLREFFDDEVRPFLDPAFNRASRLARPPPGARTRSGASAANALNLAPSAAVNSSCSCSTAGTG